MVDKQKWEDWLDEDVKDAAQAALVKRFQSLYIDMLEICRSQYSRVSNLHALAAYAVWFHTPTKLRVPQSQIELSRLLGFSDDDVFRKWRHRYPELFDDDRTKAVVRSMIMDNIPNVVYASLENAIGGGDKGFQDRKMLLDIAGVSKNSVETVVTGANGGPIRTMQMPAYDLSKLSDEELEALDAITSKAAPTS